MIPLFIELYFFFRYQRRSVGSLDKHHSRWSQSTVSVPRTWGPETMRHEIPSRVPSPQRLWWQFWLKNARLFRPTRNWKLHILFVVQQVLRFLCKRGPWVLTWSIGWLHREEGRGWVSWHLDKLVNKNLRFKTELPFFRRGWSYQNQKPYFHMLWDRENLCPVGLECPRLWERRGEKHNLDLFVASLVHGDGL